MRYNPPYGMTDPEPTFRSEPYINGNPATGTMGSIPPAASIEYDQREIVAVIQYAADHNLLDMNNIPCQPPSNGDLTQLLKAIFGIVARRVLIANVVFFVDSVIGSDTAYDGSAAAISGSKGPWKTIQYAVNQAALFYPGTFGVTINVAKGTYAPFSTPQWAHPRVVINGSAMSGANRSIIVGSVTSIINGPNSYNFNNFALQNTGGGSNNGCFAAAYGATVGIDNIQIEQCNINSSCVQAFLSSLLTVGHLVLNINSTGNIVLASGSGANLDLSSAVITMNMGLALNGAFAVAQILGNLGVQSNGNTCAFVNAGYVTGTKYASTYNGIINVQGLGPSFFPGSVAGYQNLGGQYG